MKRAVLAAGLILALAFVLWGRSPVQESGSGAPKPATLSGRVTLALPGVRFADVEPIVACLDGLSGRLAYEIPREVPVISQKDARFSPPFLVVTAGQTVSLANDDRIVHNVFSFSPPKRFDLGLYPAGESKTVTFDKPGPSDLFCSIHSKMNATVYVAPSPYHAVVSPTGGFQIAGVPPGKYRLILWSRKLPQVEREVELGSATAAPIDIVIAGDR
jgi:plastocyanin